MATINMWFVIAVIAVIFLVLAIRNEGDLPVPVVGEPLVSVVGKAK